MLIWQAELAKKYGVYGFCFYHYWFYEKPILEKPLYNFLYNKDIEYLIFAFAGLMNRGPMHGQVQIGQ